jgi:hypothetical protein
VLISVVIPTVAGREASLERCLAAYGDDVGTIVLRDRPTCGIAWQEGAELARGDFLHFSADDLEPHPGWAEAAIEAVECGYLPAPRILNADGTLQSCGLWGEEQGEGELTPFTRIPFLSREQWELVDPMIETHYWTDNWVSHRCRLAGVETRVARRYLFTHHYEPAGRLDERMEPDRIAYVAACEAAAGAP